MSVMHAIRIFRGRVVFGEVLCALFHEEMFANVDIQSSACVVYPAST